MWCRHARTYTHTRSGTCVHAGVRMWACTVKQSITTHTHGAIYSIINFTSSYIRILVTTKQFDTYIVGSSWGGCVRVCVGN